MIIVKFLKKNVGLAKLTLKKNKSINYKTNNLFVIIVYVQFTTQFFKMVKREKKTFSKKIISFIFIVKMTKFTSVFNVIIKTMEIMKIKITNLIIKIRISIVLYVLLTKKVLLKKL